MISIRKSADELDRLENLRQAMADCYVLAIDSSAEYAVEVDAQQSARFRQRLKNVSERWRAAGDPGELRLVGSSFRGELREYQSAATESLNQLRREVAAATAAIAAFAGDVVSNGADHEEHLNRELERLERAAESDDIVRIRMAVQAAITQIRAAVEQMRTSNRMVVAQLQDEIRLLHHQVTAEQRPVNPSALLRSRKQMEQKIEEALAKDVPFCLLLVAVSNWKSALGDYSNAAADLAIRQMICRLHSSVDPDLVLGRWGEDEFVALLNVDPATAISISREAARRLSGKYEIEENGERTTVELKVTAGVIDHAKGSDSPDFRIKLDLLAAALCRA